MARSIKLSDDNSNEMVGFRLTESLVGENLHMPVVADPIFDDIMYGRAFIMNTFAAIAKQTSVILGITTGEHEVFFVPEIATDVSMTVEAYKDCVFSGGTPIDLINRNLASDITTDINITRTPTVATSGELFLTLFSPSGKQSGGSTKASNGYILEAESQYILKTTNIDTSNGSVNSMSDLIELY